MSPLTNRPADHGLDRVCNFRKWDNLIGLSCQNYRLGHSKNGTALGILNDYFSSPFANNSTPFGAVASHSREDRRHERAVERFNGRPDGVIDSGPAIVFARIVGQLSSDVIDSPPDKFEMPASTGENGKPFLQAYSVIRQNRNETTKRMAMFLQRG